MSSKMITRISVRQFVLQCLRVSRARWRSLRRNQTKQCILAYLALFLCYKTFEAFFVSSELCNLLPICETSRTNRNVCHLRQACTPVTAIDAVYTWVNGSDPELISHLQDTTNKLTVAQLSNSCLLESQCAQSDQSCSLLPLLLIRPSLLNVEQHLPGSIRSEQLNETASLIYVQNVEKARSIGVDCVRIIAKQVYKLTNLCLCPDDDSTQSNIFVDSHLRLYNKSVLSDLMSNDPLKHICPSTRKQLQLLPMGITFSGGGSVLYFKKSATLNISKLVTFIRDKLNESSELEFEVEHPLTVKMTDKHFFDHQLENENIRRNRFEDNDELRYSLRSLEKYAAWIRNVYIVTNGQIPAWLNMDHPKVRLIEHQHIFPNRSHLPSFSSSAIESHLHRIPELSKRFLYFNDDIILNDHIYPDDFHTQSKGFKVYLSWPVPNCADGCPLKWLNDGYCDKACNLSKCLWDGGDCLVDEKLANTSMSSQQASSSPAEQEDSRLCASNCLGNWLGDSFCDQVCNKPECAYDMADCGVKHFDTFEQISIDPMHNTYSFSPDSQVVYLNFSQLLQPMNKRYELQMANVLYKNLYTNENASNIHSAVLNLNFNILTILFRSNTEKQALNVSTLMRINQKSFNLTFHLIPNLNNTINMDFSDANNEDYLSMTILLEQIEQNASQSKLSTARIEQPHTLPTDSFVVDCQFEQTVIPTEFREKFQQIDRQLQLERLTDHGKQHFYMQLAKLYSDLICNQTLPKENSAESEFVLAYLLSNEPNENSSTPVYRSRHLMDAYADSLIYVNHLYNKAFGVQSRQVPAHMTHFIDVDIMQRLQDRFHDNFEQTSAHKIRSSQDMQFSFAYFYFLMNEEIDCDFDSILDEFDIDRSRNLSLNELKTLLIQLHGLPIENQDNRQLYLHLNECCDNCLPISNGTIDHWFGHDLQLFIPIHVLSNCSVFRDKIVAKWPKKARNKYQIVNDEDVAFKMLRSNESLLETELDQLRSKRSKFICLNDNFEHGTNKTKEIVLRQILKNFYESILPKRCKFERPPNDDNKLLYLEPYMRWRAAEAETLLQTIQFNFNANYFIYIINIVLLIKLLFM